MHDEQKRKTIWFYWCLLRLLDLTWRPVTAVLCSLTQEVSWLKRDRERKYDSDASSDSFSTLPSIETCHITKIHGYNVSSRALFTTEQHAQATGW